MPAGVTGAPTVLLTADAVGGVWTYALDLAEALGETGVRVVLAVLGPAPSAAQHAQAAAVAGLELVALEGPLDWTANDAAELRPAALELARLARAVRAQIVHLNSPALAALAAFDRPVLGACHSCPASWWAAVRGTELPADFAWRRDLLADGYAACDALIAPTAAFARTVAELYGFIPAVVWNGRRPPTPAQGGSARFALTAGRLWDEGKDLATLDLTAARLPYPVVALGASRGPGGAGVELHRIAAPGAQSAAETALWMARAPVFVSTAVYEPFGLAVLEAAQAGAALVLSDIGSFRELWDGAALFVPPRDADGFAAALQRLLEDEAERTVMAARARRRAARYSLHAMATATRAQYAALAPAAFAAPPREAAA